MVLYLIYREPQWDRFYATIFSKATIFQIVIYILLIVPPFFIAYSTNEFWQYTSSYREQPDIDFLNNLIVQISGNNCVRTWSTYPNFNVLLDPQELTAPLIRSSQTDRDWDGIDDVLHLNLTFTNLNCSVQAVKATALFNVQFSRYARVTIRSLVYWSESWAVPAARLWIGGTLGMIQEVPFPARGQATTYNSSLFNERSPRAEDFELRNILSNYNKRDVTTYLDKPLVVWESGNSDNFTLNLELTYPVFTVSYTPGFWQLVKFAWIQYYAIFIIFWFILTKVQSFVYQNQVILTLSGKKFQKQY